MKKGFTLVELLLAISMFAIIMGIGIPVYLSFQNRNDLDVTANTIAHNFRRAQVLAQSADGDSTWGVKIQSGSIVIFKGASYAYRDQSFDESFTLSESITPGGLFEVVFSKMNGIPNVTGTVTLTSVINESRTIQLNAKGIVTY